MDRIYIGTYHTLLVQLDKLYRHNRQGSIKTRQRYRAAMIRFCAYLAEQWHVQKLDNISPKHLTAYVEYLYKKGNSAAMVKTELSAIRFFHDKMSNPRYELQGNQELNLLKRKVKGVDRTWSNQEFNLMLIEAISINREDYAALLCLAKYAGLRLEECLKLDTASAEKASRTGLLTIKGKNVKIRTVPINETIKIELQKMLKITQRGHKLFVSDNERTDHAKTRVENFIYHHRKRIQKEGRPHPITFHGLRHTYACTLYQHCRKDGLSHEAACKYVSRMLGHEREEVTTIYLASLNFKEGV